MKKIFLILIIAAIVIPSAFAMEQEKQELPSLPEIPPLPIEVKALLDRNAPELQELLREWHSRSDARRGSNVCEKPWLPNYYIKYGVERVANAQRLKTVIQEHGLNLLKVPEKYLYHVPELPDTLRNESHLVVVKKVEGRVGKNQNLNLKQTKQLYKVALLAGHYDLHKLNYISTTNSELMTIIDTDEVAMPSLQKIEQYKQNWLCQPHLIYTPLFHFYMDTKFSKWSNYDDQAYAYLEKKITTIMALRMYPQINSKKSRGI